MPQYGQVIVIKRTGADGYHFPLTAASCLFGRKKECDIRIQLPHVSKEHCKLEVNENNEVILSNLSDVNLTSLNGKVILHSERLKHGDVFTIIDRSFRFEYPLDSGHFVDTRIKRNSSSLKNETLQVLHVQQEGEHGVQPTKSCHSISGHISDPVCVDRVFDEPIKPTKAKPDSQEDEAPKQQQEWSFADIKDDRPAAKEVSPFSQLYEMYKNQALHMHQKKTNQTNSELSTPNNTKTTAKPLVLPTEESKTNIFQGRKRSRTPLRSRSMGQASVEENKMPKEDDSNKEGMKNLEASLVQDIPSKDLGKPAINKNTAKKRCNSVGLGGCTENLSSEETIPLLESSNAGDVHDKTQNDHQINKDTPEFKRKSHLFTTQKSLNADEVLKEIHDGLESSMGKEQSIVEEGKLAEKDNTSVHVAEKKISETPKRRGRPSLRFSQIKVTEMQTEQPQFETSEPITGAKSPAVAKGKGNSFSSPPLPNGKGEDGAPENVIEAERLKKTSRGSKNLHKFLTNEETEEVLFSGKQMNKSLVGGVEPDDSLTSNKLSPSPQGAVSCPSRKRRSENLEKRIDEPASKQKRVSFGVNLCPEVFDKCMPPNSPLRKGGTPRRFSTPFRVSANTALKRALNMGLQCCITEELTEPCKRSSKFSTATPIKSNVPLTGHVGTSPEGIEMEVKNPSPARSPTARSPALGRESPGAKSPSPGRKSLPTKTTSPGRKSLADKSPIPGRKSLADKSPSPGRKSLAAQSLAPERKSLAAKTPSSGRKSLAAKTPSPGRKSLAAKTPSPGRKSLAAQSPSLGRKSLAAKTPSPGRKSLAAKTPSPGRKSLAALSPSPERKSLTAKTPSSGRKSLAAKTPSPGRKSLAAQSPSPERKSLAAKTPSPGRKSLAAQSPSPERKSLAAKTPSPGRKSLAAQSPSPERKSLTAKTPSSGRKSLAAKTPSPGRKSLAAQSPSPERKSLAAKTPSPGRKSLAAKTPSPGRKSLAAQSPSPERKSLAAKTPSPGRKSLAAQSPSPERKSLPAKTPSPGRKSTSAKRLSPDRKSFTSPVIKKSRASGPFSIKVPATLSVKSPRSAKIPSLSDTKKSAKKLSSTKKSSPSAAKQLARPASLGSFDRSPSVCGRFSVSRIDTPPILLIKSDSPQVSRASPSSKLKQHQQTNKPSNFKKTPSRKSTRRSSLAAGLYSRRQSGASVANLLVKKSWAQVVKEGVAKSEFRSAPKKHGVMMQRRIKKNLSSNIPKTPIRSMKDHFSTGHAASPATIVIGKARATIVKTTGIPPRIVTNVSLRRKSLAMDQSFTGELIISPLTAPGRTRRRTSTGSLTYRADLSSKPKELHLKQANISKVVEEPTDDLASGCTLITPKEKTKPVVELNRPLETPKVKGIPVDGIKQIMKTPKIKRGQVEDFAGQQKVMAEFKQKAKSPEVNYIGVKEMFHTTKKMETTDYSGLDEMFSTKRTDEAVESELLQSSNGSGRKRAAGSSFTFENAECEVGQTVDSNKLSETKLINKMEQHENEQSVTKAAPRRSGRNSFSTPEIKLTTIQDQDNNTKSPPFSNKECAQSSNQLETTHAFSKHDVVEFMDSGVSTKEASDMLEKSQNISGVPIIGTPTKAFQQRKDELKHSEVKKDEKYVQIILENCEKNAKCSVVERFESKNVQAEVNKLTSPTQKSLKEKNEPENVQGSAVEELPLSHESITTNVGIVGYSEENKLASPTRRSLRVPNVKQNSQTTELQELSATIKNATPVMKEPEGRQIKEVELTTPKRTSLRKKNEYESDQEFKVEELSAPRKTVTPDKKGSWDQQTEEISQLVSPSLKFREKSELQILEDTEVKELLIPNKTITPIKKESQDGDTGDINDLVPQTQRILRGKDENQHTWKRGTQDAPVELTEFPVAITRAQRGRAAKKAANSPIFLVLKESGKIEGENSDEISNTNDAFALIKQEKGKSKGKDNIFCEPEEKSEKDKPDENVNEGVLAMNEYEKVTQDIQSDSNLPPKKKMPRGKAAQKEIENKGKNLKAVKVQELLPSGQQTEEMSQLVSPSIKLRGKSKLPNLQDTEVKELLIPNKTVTLDKKASQAGQTEDIIDLVPQTQRTLRGKNSNVADLKENYAEVVKSPVALALNRKDESETQAPHELVDLTSRKKETHNVQVKVIDSPVEVKDSPAAKTSTRGKRNPVPQAKKTSNLTSRKRLQKGKNKIDNGEVSEVEKNQCVSFKMSIQGTETKHSPGPGIDISNATAKKLRGKNANVDEAEEKNTASQAKMNTRKRGTRNAPVEDIQELFGSENKLKDQQEDDCKVEVSSSQKQCTEEDSATSKSKSVQGKRTNKEPPNGELKPSLDLAKKSRKGRIQKVEEICLKKTVCWDRKLKPDFALESIQEESDVTEFPVAVTRARRGRSAWKAVNSPISPELKECGKTESEDGDGICNANNAFALIKQEKGKSEEKDKIFCEPELSENDKNEENVNESALAMDEYEKVTQDIQSDLNLPPKKKTPRERAVQKKIQNKGKNLKEMNLRKLQRNKPEENMGATTGNVLHMTAEEKEESPLPESRLIKGNSSVVMNKRVTRSKQCPVETSGQTEPQVDLTAVDVELCAVIEELSTPAEIPKEQGKSKKMKVLSSQRDDEIKVIQTRRNTRAAKSTIAIAKECLAEDDCAADPAVQIIDESFEVILNESVPAKKEKAAKTKSYIKRGKRKMEETAIVLQEVNEGGLKDPISKDEELDIRVKTHRRGGRGMVKNNPVIAIKANVNITENECNVQNLANEAEKYKRARRGNASKKAAIVPVVQVEEAEPIKRRGEKSKLEIQMSGYQNIQLKTSGAENSEDHQADLPSVSKPAKRMTRANKARGVPNMVEESLQSSAETSLTPASQSSSKSSLRGKRAATETEDTAALKKAKTKEAVDGKMTTRTRKLKTVMSTKERSPEATKPQAKQTRCTTKSQK